MIILGPASSRDAFNVSVLIHLVTNREGVISMISFSPKEPFLNSLFRRLSNGRSSQLS